MEDLLDFGERTDWTILMGDALLARTQGMADRVGVMVEFLETMFEGR